MPRKVSEISRYLESLSTEELIDEIRELHKIFPVVKEYYQVKLSDDGEEELLSKYRKIIRDAFSLHYDFNGPELRVARKAVNDFMKLSNNSSNVADIMIYYAEMGIKFTNDYGDIDEPFYASIEKMYEKVAGYITERLLQEKFVNRLKKMVIDTNDIGWGFHDNLEDIFLNYFPGIPITKS